MLLINRSNPKTDLIFTLTELTTIVTPVYLLVLTSDFNRTKSRFILPLNISSNLNRYDHFKVDTSTLNDLDTGLYTYAVYQSSISTTDESVLGNPVETGKAKIIAPAVLVQPIIYESEDTSDFYTYKSIND
ncbi:hypothetical protein [Mucilaginibacter ginsenosidivorax]|uniref:Uncharacterized protein n=1 Tax=Mucilaginibacter ginsenosidivorax TaxID=862126 RepID=A0A5B8W7A6_9SPHI|nr:hypothetical protein [Mucilaginibacter ginsenosidivorax]QEC78772.1 hypothetical protein FSB76_23510 [Mucilaginibacter ginsenosidivorax]